MFKPVRTIHISRGSKRNKRSVRGDYWAFIALHMSCKPLLRVMDNVKFKNIPIYLLLGLEYNLLTVRCVGWEGIMKMALGNLTNNEWLSVFNSNISSYAVSFGCFESVNYTVLAFSFVAEKYESAAFLIQSSSVLGIDGKGGVELRNGEAKFILFCILLPKLNANGGVNRIQTGFER